MIRSACWTFAEIEAKVCDIASSQLGIPRGDIQPASSLVEDLGCDSLDLLELVWTIEKYLHVTLPSHERDPVYKSIFTRQPFRIRDLAELVYIRQGTGTDASRVPGRGKDDGPTAGTGCFTQLDGWWRRMGVKTLFEPLPDAATEQYRRRSDGMRCVRIPAATVEIGCDTSESLDDERPKHHVSLGEFLIDAEPVSTSAYCRFINSISDAEPAVLREWFVLDPADDRNKHMLVMDDGETWRPIAGAERMPMILVSWYGANAYSLWANDRDWRWYRDEPGWPESSFLPSEAQWEYAARGLHAQRYPWGDAPPSDAQMCFGRHSRGASYRADTLPMAEVHVPLGVSMFGLNHMAGNVWQWCRDHYDPAFYETAEARAANTVNRTPTGVRSEQGGSWVGSADLCRSSYRRGRPRQVPRLPLHQFHPRRPLRPVFTPKFRLESPHRRFSCRRFGAHACPASLPPSHSFLSR